MQGKEGGGLVFEIEIESGVMSAPLPCLSGLAVTTEDRSERKRKKTDETSFRAVLHPIPSEREMEAEMGKNILVKKPLVQIWV